MQAIKTLNDQILQLSGELLSGSLTEAQRGDLQLIAGAARKLDVLLSASVDPRDSLQLRRFIHDALTQANIMGGFAGIALRDSVMTDQQQGLVNQIIDRARRMQDVLMAMPRL